MPQMAEKRQQANALTPLASSTCDSFLNSNFWQTYRQHGSPSIEDLLSKPDCTVEKLLDDEDILQEFKT